MLNYPLLYQCKVYKAFDDDRQLNHFLEMREKTTLKIYRKIQHVNLVCDVFVELDYCKSINKVQLLLQIGDEEAINVL